jgi:hypothetical protein
VSLDPTIVRFFEKKGYTTEQAKGIAAGIYAETANNHTAFNGDGGGQGAYGLGQWRGPRLKALREQFGKYPSKSQQLEFLHSELQGGDPGGALVTAKKNAKATFESYINDFMRPGGGARGDLQRGYGALGLKGGDRASAGGGSTLDRLQARRRAQQGPSMQAVYDAYRNTGKAGGMTPQEATQFERAVLDGHVMLPRGAAIKAKPAVAALPRSVVEAYNSHRMDDDPDARAQLEQAVHNGEVALPRGMQLKAPAARTVGDRLGMGTRSILENAGGILDIVGAPVNQTINALAGTNLNPTPGKNLGVMASDALGLAKPESGAEQFADAVTGGATQGLLTAGAGLAAAGAKGAVGAAGRALSSSPLLDTISGAASGGSQETARQAGAGPAGQIAAGLLGGAAPIGLAAAAERVATRGVRTLPDVVAQTPRAAVIDEAGDLTPDGIEIAARHDVSPEALREAYDAPPAVQRGTANDDAMAPVAREATTGEPVARAPASEPASVPDYVDRYIAGEYRDGRTTPEVEQFAANNAPDIEAEFARRQAGEAPVELPPQPNAPGNPSVDGAVPASARVAQAAEFGVPLTRGQATKSFDIQDREQRLRNSNGPQGEAMRQFSAQQVEQVKQAINRFREAFGDTSASAVQRGQVVQDAVSELRDLGQKGVSALYRQARELGEEVPLETSGIRGAYERLMVEADVPDSVKNVLTQEAARYGIIGKAAGTAENKITTVKIDDGAGGERALKFYGHPEALRLDNAEAFRQVVSKQYRADGGQKLTQILKSAIDDATEEAATKLAQYGQEGAKVPDALKAARGAHITQQQTFKAGDVVQAIADWKKGKADVTRVLSPEQVMSRALGKTSDLKRIKAVLLSGATPASKAGWRAIQAHGLATIYEKSLTQNTNIGGEITEAVSGAKLRSAIGAFGPDKLKVLLDSGEFNTLMKLRRTIEDVTIPITGTVNHSNSGNLLMRLAKDADNQVTAAFGAAGFAVGGPAGAAVGGTIGRTISPAIVAAKEGRAASATLKDATEYTAERAADDVGDTPSAASRAGQATKAVGTKTIKAFIDTYSSPRVIAPLLVSTSGAEE